MKAVYLTTKTIQIKPCTIFSSNQLGLEVERPERSTKFSFFAILHDIRNIFSFYVIFQAPYTELAALFMKFPTRG